jgi:hypothetical protein
MAAIKAAGMGAKLVSIENKEKFKQFLTITNSLGIEPELKACYQSV